MLLNDADAAEPCISDLVMSAWHAGELDAERDRNLSQHLARCVRCRGRDHEQRAEAVQFLSRAAVPDEVERLSRALARSKPKRTLRYASLAVAAAALLALWRAPEQLAQRRKGADSVGFYVRREGRLFRGQSGERVRPGDQLRFTWRSDRPTYLVILSLDAKRVVSTYHPAGAVSRLEPTGAEIELPGAVELDATLGPEAVFAIACLEAPNLEQLRRSLRAAGQPQLPAGCSLSRITLYKESP